MRHDFIYCPGCTRYSIVCWQVELSAWECEDCGGHIAPEEDRSSTMHETLAS